MRTQVVALGLLLLWAPDGIGREWKDPPMIEDPAELDKLRGKKTIEGDLRINGLENLSALRDLVSIQGALVISNCALRNLRGLRNLKSIGGEFSLDAEAVKSLDGLARLESVGGDFEIVGSKRFPADRVSGFERLRYVGGDFSIAACKLRGRSRSWVVGPFPALVHIGGALTINAIRGDRRRARKLEVTGFEKLVSVGGDVFIRHAARVAPFPALAQVAGAIEFSGGPALDRAKVFPALKQGRDGGH